jgi:hypothetical protein
MSHLGRKAAAEAQIPRDCSGCSPFGTAAGRFVYDRTKERATVKPGCQGLCTAPALPNPEWHITGGEQLSTGYSGTAAVENAEMDRMRKYGAGLDGACHRGESMLLFTRSWSSGQALESTRITGQSGTGASNGGRRTTTSSEPTIP